MLREELESAKVELKVAQAELVKLKRKHGDGGAAAHDQGQAVQQMLPSQVGSGLMGAVCLAINGSPAAPLRGLGTARHAGAGGVAGHAP